MGYHICWPRIHMEYWNISAGCFSNKVFLPHTIYHALSQPLTQSRAYVRCSVVVWTLGFVWAYVGFIHIFMHLNAIQHKTFTITHISTIFTAFHIQYSIFTKLALELCMCELAGATRHLQFDYWISFETCLRLFPHKYIHINVCGQIWTVQSVAQLGWPHVYVSMRARVQWAATL